METEKAKMLRGELYDSLDPDLFRERRAARALVTKYNSLTFADDTSARDLLKEMLGSVGDECFVEMPFRCDYGYNIHLGKGVYMNFNCVLLDVCEIRIGDRVLFAPGVQIYTATHPVETDVRATGLELGKAITIGDDVWIGGGAIVLPGVTIGNGSVIGAGSVVTKDVPPMCVYAGNPARLVRKIEPSKDGKRS